MVASNIKTTVPLPSPHQPTQKTTVQPHPHAPQAPCPESPHVRRRSLQASCVGRGGAVDGVGEREGGAVRLQPDVADRGAGVLAAHGGAGQDLLHAAGEVHGRAGAAIRASLSDVKDTSSEVKQLEEQAAAVMKAARAEISSALNQMKKETTAELETKPTEGRRKVKAELQEALQSLEKQKDDTIKALDSQIAALSDEIVKKVLPTT